jgi:hypothetical protein
VQIRAPDGEYQSGQAGARSDIHYRGTDRQQVSDDRAVEQVPIPQPGHFAWADQAAIKAGAGEQLGEPRRYRQTVAEEHGGDFGWVGKVS